MTSASYKLDQAVADLRDLVTDVVRVERELDNYRDMLAQRDEIIERYEATIDELRGTVKARDTEIELLRQEMRNAKQTSAELLSQQEDELAVLRYRAAHGIAPVRHTGGL